LRVGQGCSFERLLVLFVVIVFGFIVIFIRQIAVFVEVVFVFLEFVIFFIFLEFIGDGIQRNRMRLRHLEFGFAFGTAEDLALLNFVFVHINFGRTLWATEHGSILRFGLCAANPGHPRNCRPAVLYTGVGKVNLNPLECNPSRATYNRSMAREYPEKPVVGVGGVVIENDRVLLIRRGTEPLLGQWSIPGGTLELGESIQAGVARELLEETGLEVRVLDLIEAFDRIFRSTENGLRPRYHYVILDYLCERVSGEARAGSDVTDVVYVKEDDLPDYQLTETATRVVRNAFAMYRSRQNARS